MLVDGDIGPHKLVKVQVKLTSQTSCDVMLRKKNIDPFKSCSEYYDQVVLSSGQNKYAT